MTYTGRYEAPLGKRGRFFMPRDLREALKADNPDNWRTIHIVYEGQEYPNHLLLFDDATWQNRSSFYKTVDPENHTILTEILSTEKTVVIDSQNRVGIPAKFRKRLQLEDEVVLYGHFNCIELFNPKQYSDRFELKEGETFETIVNGLETALK